MLRLHWSIPVVLLFAASCAFGTHETEATNAGDPPEDSGAIVQEGSIVPPFESGTIDAMQDVPLEDASAADADSSFCASKPDGTVCEPSTDSCHDDGVCEGSVCRPPAPKLDGTVCGGADVCHEAPTCEAGQCTERPKPDGTPCAPAPDACHEDGVCSGGVCGAVKQREDGYNWDPSDTWKRCCGGQPLRMDTDAHCGVCGIACNASNGESCQKNAANGQYYCTGCIASAGCWSGCCSTSFGTPHRCAASDCVQGLCEGCPGGTCHQWPDASNSCSYP